MRIIMKKIMTKRKTVNDRVIDIITANYIEGILHFTSNDKCKWCSGMTDSEIENLVYQRTVETVRAIRELS
jgi:hypothetical protein